MAAGGIGANCKPSRQSLGTSRANVRLKASIAEKVNATQSSPPERERASADVGSNAILKMTITRSAKTAAELKTSLVRNSDRRSVGKIAAAARQKPAGRIGARPLAGGWGVGAGIVSSSLAPNCKSWSELRGI